MPGFPIRQVRRAVPTGPFRVDPTHPLARGLVGCWLPSIDPHKNWASEATDLNSLNFRPNVMTSEGPSNPTVQQPASLPLLNSGSEKSFYWRGSRIGASTGSFAGYIQVSFTNGVTSPFTVWGMDMGVSDLTAGRVVWNSGGTPNTLSALPTTTIGAITSFGATFKVGGNVNGYSAGLNVGSASFGASAPTVGSNSQLWLHAHIGGESQGYLNAGCLIACAWSRELSADEMALMDMDPYGFLVPLTLLTPFFSSNAVSSSGSLTLGGIRFSGAAAVPEMSQGALHLVGISFAGFSDLGPTSSGVLALRGISFAGVSSVAHTAAGVLAFSGIAIHATSLVLPPASAAQRSFWTFGA